MPRSARASAGGYCYHGVGMVSGMVSDLNGTRIRINVLRIDDLRSTLTSIRFIELYINNIE